MLQWSCARCVFTTLLKVKHHKIFQSYCVIYLLRYLFPHQKNTRNYGTKHNYETSSSAKSNLIKKFYETNRNGKYSIIVIAVESWNKIQKQLNNMLFKDLSPNKNKTTATSFYLKSY